MVRDRMFTEDAERRSPSPCYMSRSRDFDSSKNRNFSPNAHRVAVDYSPPVRAKAHKINRTERHSRDSDACVRRAYDDRDDICRGRDRDIYMVGGGRSTSPRRHQYRGGFGTRSPRENAEQGCRRRERDSDRYPRSPIFTERRGDIDGGFRLRSSRLLGSNESGKIREAVGFDSRFSWRSYEEHHRRDDLLDRYKAYDNVIVRDDYDRSCGFGGFGETKLTREEDSLKNLRCRRDAVSIVTSPHISSFSGDQGQFRLHDGPRKEKRDHDRGYYFEKEYTEFYPEDELLGIEKRRGLESHGKQRNFQSSRGYFDDGNNYISLPSYSKDFPSSVSLMREDFPGYESLGNIHMTPHSIETGNCLSPRPVFYANEKEQMMHPEGLGAQLNDTKSLMSLRPVEEDYGQYYSVRVFNESSHDRYTREGSLKRFPHPEARLTLEKVGAFDSVHARSRDLVISRDGNSYVNYDSETKQPSGYGSGQLVEHYNGGDGDSERYDMLQSIEYTPSASTYCVSPHKRFVLEELNLAERYKYEVPCEYDDGGFQISTDENGVRRVWRSSAEMANHQPFSSQFVPWRSASTRKSNYKDIKRRPSPVSKNRHVSQRVKKFKPSAKGRSYAAASPSKKHTSLPWLKKF